MADQTAIQWTHSTWNPWYGCHKVSPGCASCYAERDMSRYGKNFDVVTRAADATFKAPLKWQREKEAVPARARERRLVFTCSWGDFFHEAADEWRDDAWLVIRSCPDLTFQVLTKRPERIADHLPADWGTNGENYPNVWLGTSVENNQFLGRVQDLCQVPAQLRFVSAEPLLGEVSLAPWLGPLNVLAKADPETGQRQISSGGIEWVIVGGESVGRPGHPPRTMHAAWAEKLRDECRQFNVPFYFKQWGAASGGTARGAATSSQAAPTCSCREISAAG